MCLPSGLSLAMGNACPHGLHGADGGLGIGLTQWLCNTPIQLGNCLG